MVGMTETTAGLVQQAKMLKNNGDYEMAKLHYEETISALESELEQQPNNSVLRITLRYLSHSF